MLVNAGFKSQHVDAVAACMFLQIVEHQFGEAEATKLRSNIHPFDLAVITAKELHTSTTDQSTVIADNEKKTPFCNSFSTL